MKGLQGKVALVTGGSSGIGQAIAIRLGADGASVAINYVGRSEGAVSTKEAIEHGVEMCMKQVAEAGGRPILVGADVSDEQAVEQMFDRVMSEYGRLDILVNNAGIQIAGGLRRAVRRRLRQGPRGEPARRVPVRPPGRATASWPPNGPA